MDRRVAFPFVIQGSGWGWLGYNKATGKLQIATCPNQVSVTSAINITEVSCLTRTDIFPTGSSGGNDRTDPSVRDWRVGARLLPAVQERQAGLCQSHLPGDRVLPCFVSYFIFNPNLSLFPTSPYWNRWLTGRTSRRGCRKRRGDDFPEFAAGDWF